MSRTLVVYYSRSGNTRDVAQRLAAALDADLEAITATDRSGALGWIRCAVEGYFTRAAAIGPSAKDPAAYDLVVIGTPIWSASLSGPVRAYLRRHRSALPDVAFFCTYGGEGHEHTFAQMTEAAGQLPRATLAVKQADLAEAGAAITAFAAQLRTRGNEHVENAG